MEHSDNDLRLRKKKENEQYDEINNTNSNEWSNIYNN